MFSLMNLFLCSGCQCRMPKTCRPIFESASRSSANPRRQAWETSKLPQEGPSPGTSTPPMASFVGPSWGHIGLSGLQLVLGSSCCSPQGFQVGLFTSLTPPPDLEAIALTVFGKPFYCRDRNTSRLNTTASPSCELCAALSQASGRRHCDGQPYIIYGCSMSWLARLNACLDAQNCSANPRICVEILC